MNQKSLNLENKQHARLIKNIAEQALKGITSGEIVSLRNICETDRYTYYNKLKLKYISLLGMIGLNFTVTEEIEEAIFFLIHEIIHQITITNGEDISELSIQIS